MVVRSFFWDGRTPSRLPRLLRRSRASLRVGNAGDLFNRDLVKHLYGQRIENIEDAGNRLLLVGSVVHRVRDSDVVCGVGTKGTVLPPPPPGVTVRGLRGPLTIAALEEAGYDLSELKFALDPGLLAKEVYPHQSATPAKHDRVIFIPHYRDRARYSSTRQYRVIDVDAEPGDFVREIARAEYVYSASLHGIIFAHALGRPCTLVQPDSGEPEIKYRDYFSSVDLKWRTPTDIHAALKLPKSDVLANTKTSADFDFPSLEDLLRVGIADTRTT